MKKIIITFLLLLFQIVIGNQIYNPIKKDSYLLGKFNPKKYSHFIEINKLKIPTHGKKIYLRKRVALALRNVYKALKKDLPGIPFWITSGIRSYWQQKAIWEAKWTGKRKVDGIKLNKVKNRYKRAKKILKYSSMPGTSRHHWGTDFDLNILLNKYYTKGKGRILYLWLKKNMPKYGFCQVYNNNNRTQGYEEEKWHWSYIPIAKKLYIDWLNLYGNNIIKLMKKSKFLGSKYKKILKLAPIYVREINQSCR